MTERISKYIKALAACAACVGVLVSPEQQEAILSGFMAVYAIISGLQGRMFK